MLTPEQFAVARSSNLSAIKAMVPAEVDPNAIAAEERLQPLLSVNIQYHENTDEGYAVIQYLIDQGADVNQENPLVW